MSQTLRLTDVMSVEEEATHKLQTSTFTLIFAHLLIFEIIFNSLTRHCFHVAPYYIRISLDDV